MPRVTLILMLGVVVAGCAQQGPVSPYAGTWTMTLGARTLIVLTLDGPDGSIGGSLSRPQHFETGDFVHFSKITQAVTAERVERSDVRDGRLHFTTTDPADPSDTTDYEMTLVSGDRAVVRIADVPPGMESMLFTRAMPASAPVVYMAWEPERSYSVDDEAMPDTELQRLYEADQKVRQDYASFSANAAVIARQDAERRAQVKALLAGDQLRAAEDFKRAAFIFQHGDTPDDYLLAHTLATLAVAKGDPSAMWIATATLDRYLQSSGKPQIFGTQFKDTTDHHATQDPYDRGLISDALRRQLGVPSLAAQQAQQEDWSKQFQAAAAAPAR